MTEHMLLATTAHAVLWLVEGVESDRDTVPPKLSAVLFAAMWTRYEAWPVIAAAVAAAGYATWRRGGSFDALVRRGCPPAIWPAPAGVIFLVNHPLPVGAWVVGEGFYVP